ncbi:MAG: GatB/YqeY domain-containing protein [Candidatus Niyogibacteria bacterium]|nr:GatB/YqeY domain-containing protein [Candidatus Niyogibacteria bacterium]
MLKKKLESDLKNALRAGEALKVSVLRMLLASIANKEIEVLKKEVGLSDEEILEVLGRELKRRKEAAGEFAKGGRQEMAAKESEEAGIVASYLPEEISDGDLQRVVKDSIRETGAGAMADFGKVMKAAMAVLKGKAAGNRVSEAVKKFLSEKASENG